MVKERVAVSDSEEEVVTRSAKKPTASARDVSKNKEEDSDRMDEDEPVEEKEEEEEEEEYEIEAILDARRGAFGEGKMGYFVKWKNYDEKHNSWVNEDDAGNAQVLITEFWRNHGKKGKQTAQPRKSTDAKARKSVSEREESSDEEKRPKKRGRVSKAQDEQEDEQPQPEKKRGRKSTNGAKAKKSPEPMSEDDEDKWVNVQSLWKAKSSWEPLIQSVDTVERADDGRLLIYFTLKNGKGRAREDSAICRPKMANMLLDFYEGNLRWREDTAKE